MLIIDASATWVNATIESCQAGLDISTGVGGGIAATNALLELHSTTIASCTAAVGGGAWMGGSEVQGSGSTAIRDCSASVAGGGVAIIATSSDGSQLRSVAVSRCSSATGGGMWVGPAAGVVAYNTTWQRCAVSRGGSRAGDDGAPGGGIAAALGSTVTLVGCRVHMCASTGPGGGIYADGAHVRMSSQTTLSACTAGGSGGAVALVEGAAAIMENSAVLGNRAEEGGAASVLGRSSADFNACVLANNRVSVPSPGKLLYVHNMRVVVSM